MGTGVFAGRYLGDFPLLLIETAVEDFIYRFYYLFVLYIESNTVHKGITCKLHEYLRRNSPMYILFRRSVLSLSSNSMEKSSGNLKQSLDSSISLKSFCFQLFFGVKSKLECELFPSFFVTVVKLLYESKFVATICNFCNCFS